MIRSSAWEAGHPLGLKIAVDLFFVGRTDKFETVCLLSKLHEAKHHVNVRLDMDELDITSVILKS